MTKRTQPVRRIFLCGTAALGVSAVALFPAPVSAQTADVPPSRAVVQPLPPEGIDDLDQALKQLAKDPHDVDALIGAGNASLKLNDVDAAIGFLGRADELSPGNPRVKVGLAGAFVNSKRPLEALRLFDEAEKAGASTLSLAADRGLAYDLVGDPLDAQDQYRKALSVRGNDEVIRRLALSQAISGDQAAFEKTLYPLLVKRDFAAYRTRAFGLAILGHEEDAVKIVDAVMPKAMAAQMTPYLRYMRRLTKAQQAAAANLGEFPRAAQIGRDDPRIAQYIAQRQSVAVSAKPPIDTSLTPAGEPLGPKLAKSVPRRRADRTSNMQADAKPAASSLAAVVERQASPAPAAAASANQAELPPVTRSAAPIPSSPARPTFDLATVAKPEVAPVALPSQESTPPVAAQPVPPPAPSSAPSPVPPPARVADAFAAFAKEKPKPDLNGAVDISVIKPPREKPLEPAAKPVVKPEPPRNPSRVWVQVATGRNRKALAFDWRKMIRKNVDLLGKMQPYVAKWGQTNRLLTGPYPSEKAALDAVKALKKAGQDSFTFTSSAGEEIESLP